MTILPPITGNVVFDIAALVCSVLVLVFLAWALVTGAGLFADWRRSRKPVRPLAFPPAPVVSEPAPAVRKRSPFAGKRVAR